MLSISPIPMPSQQQNPDICLNIDPKDYYLHRWCTFEAVDLPTFIEQIIYFAIVIIIGFVAIRSYIRVRRFQASSRYGHMFGDAYFWMHYIIFGWLASTIIRISLSIFTYIWFMHGNNQDKYVPDPPISSPIVILASVYELFNFICAFLVNLLQILVLFQFLKNLIQNLNQSQIITFKIKRIFKLFLKVLNGVRLYCKYVRNLFSSIALLQPFFFFFLYFSQKCQRIIFYNYYFISSQTLVIIILYICAGVILLYLYKKSLLKIQSTDIKRLILYSSMFALILIARVAINFIFTQLIFKQSSPQLKLYQPNSHCTNTNDNSIGLAIMLPFHHIIIHILPICIILYIYRPTLAKYQKQSLLDNKSQNGSFLQSDVTYRSISTNFYKEAITQPPKFEQNRPIESVVLT